MHSLVCIFDLDGTLFNSREQIINAVNAARSRHGFSQSTTEFIQSKIGLPAKELFSDLSNIDVTKFNLVEIFRENLKIEIQLFNPIFPGVLKLLTYLKSQDVRLCVASNKPTDLAIWTIDHSELAGFFDHIQGSSQFLPKPHPAILNECLKSHNTKRAFMFGDRAEDMQAAVSAGVVGIGVAQNGLSENELRNCGASFTIPSFLFFDDISRILFDEK